MLSVDWEAPSCAAASANGAIFWTATEASERRYLKGAALPSSLSEIASGVSPMSSRKRTDTQIAADLSALVLKSPAIDLSAITTPEHLRTIIEEVATFNGVVAGMERAARAVVLPKDRNQLQRFTREAQADEFLFYIESARRCIKDRHAESAAVAAYHAGQVACEAGLCALLGQDVALARELRRKGSEGRKSRDTKTSARNARILRRFTQIFSESEDDLGNKVPQREAIRRTAEHLGFTEATVRGVVRRHAQHFRR